MQLPKKKTIIIALSIFGFVFLVLGGFLLWRVNQQKTLAPEDSEAGGIGDGCENWTSWCKCPSNVNGFHDCIPKGSTESCGNIACGTAKRCLCCNGVWVKSNDGNCSAACRYNGGYGAECEPDTPVVQCFCESWGDGCGVNCTFPSGTLEKTQKEAREKCRDTVAMCYVPTGEVRYQHYTRSHPCYGKTHICKNPLVLNPCSQPPKPEPPKPEPPKPEPIPEPEPEPEPNVCDGGNWESKPFGIYPYCEKIGYSFLTKDSDGIDKESIIVQFNGDENIDIEKTSITNNDEEVRVSGVLSTESNCLKPGEYTLNASWKDKKGAAGTQCTLTTSFTVLDEIKNPNWDIKKEVVAMCIDENTSNPKAKLDYTITIINKGGGVGEIVSITDILDKKVLKEYIVNIDSGGQFRDGVITWMVGDNKFNPGESKSYTYSYTVPFNAFGDYENTVKAKPSEGTTLLANANITADCMIFEEKMENEDLPGTGVFDDGQKPAILGFILLVLGFTWRLIGRGILLSFNGVSLRHKKVKKDIRRSVNINRKKKFEKRMLRD